MSDVRTDPLTPEEIATYHEQGYLFPIRVLDDAQVEELARGARRPSRGPARVADLRADRPDRRLEPGRRRPSAPARRRRARDDRGREEAALGAVPLQPLGARRALLEGRLEPRDRRHGAPAPRLEGGRPDGGRRRDQEAGRRRQALLAPGLRLLAARLARRRHVLDRARRRRRRERRRCRWRRARTSSARSCRSSSATAARSCTTSGPGIEALQHARGGRARGRSATSSRPASAASTTRCSGTPPGRTRAQNPRRGFIPRYVAGGTMWLGALRFPYNYTDEELELRAGRPDPRPALPAHRDRVLTRRAHAAARHASRDAPPVVGVGRHLDAAAPRRSGGSRAASRRGARPTRSRPSRGSRRRRRGRARRSRRPRP